MKNKCYRLALLFSIALTAHDVAAQDRGFKVIVNDAVSVSTLTAEQVSHLFLKKKTTWTGGAPVRPADLPSSSSVRKLFSKSILKRDVGSVSGYWQVQIFSGKSTPPAEKTSDEAVMSYVAATPGAIGYVSSGANLVAGVKEIPVN